MTEPSPRPEPASTGFTFDKLVGFRRKLDAQRQEDPDRPVVALLEREYAKKRAELAAAEGVSEEEVEARVEAEVAGRGLFGRRRPAAFPAAGSGAAAAAGAESAEAEEEWVPEDDTVIGRAFRGSLVAFAAVALVVLGVWLFLSRPAPERAEQAIEAAAPELVETAAEAPSIPFREITRDAGIDFTHYSGAYGDKLLPETMGGGGAFFDHDGDGDPDLLLVNSAPWPWAPDAAVRPTSALYVNDGAGRFRDVTAAVGLDRTFYGQGVAVGDYDGDGDPDLFFTAVGPNRLFENRDGRYVEVTDRAGVAGEPDAWSTAAAFFDYDGDGDLDLFVGNYVRWSKEVDFEVDYRLTGVGRAYGPPMNYRGSHSYLYRNDGDGTFTDVSEEAGIQVANPATGEPAGKALGVLPIDVDEDGALDLLVANDTVGNFFFHNQGDGTFSEDGAAFGLAYDRMGNATGAMGVDAARYRNDADLGFVIGNFANEMTSLYVSQGDPTLFADEAIGEGIGASSRAALSFGVFLFDADLDGRLDLLQANGHLEEEIDAVDPSQTYRQPAQLFWNAGSDARSTFVQVPAETLGDLARPIVGRGSAYADVDGDGDLDVVLFQTGDPPLLLRNDQALGHHWVRLKLVGRPPNREAIGARVALTTNGVTQHRQVNPTKSYLSQSELPLTFGLGQADRVERVDITWPDGTEQRVEAVPIDRVVTIEQPG